MGNSGFSGIYLDLVVLGFDKRIAQFIDKSQWYIGYLLFAIGYWSFILSFLCVHI